jgi:hypothetical protein
MYPVCTMCAVCTLKLQSTPRATPQSLFFLGDLVSLFLGDLGDPLGAAKLRSWHAIA